MSTADRSRGGPPSSSPAPSMRLNAMNCSFNPGDFTRVQIHTAKCAICDARNMSVMLRCPGCGHQVCQPCVDAKGGAPLVHGNQSLGSEPVALTSTPIRRRVFNRADTGGVAAAEDSSSPAPDPAIAREGIAAESTAGGTARSSNHSIALHLPEVPKSAPKKRALPKLKGKDKARAASSDPDSNSSDGDFLLGNISPPPTSKRRKTSAGKSGDGEGGVKNTNLSRAARNPPLSFARSFRSAGVKTPFDHNVNPRPTAETVPSSRAREGSLQALLEQVGVDTPGLRYQEHLLGRHQLVTHNPYIGSPPRPPRPSLAQIQENIRAKAVEVGFGSAAHEQTGTSKQPDTELTLSNWIASEARQFRQTNNQSTEVERIFMHTLTATVYSALAKASKDLSPASRGSPGPECIPGDAENRFHEAAYKMQLAEAVALATERTFKDLNIPGKPKIPQNDVSVPSKQAAPSAPTNMREVLPPIANFAVTPSPNRSGPLLGYSHSPHPVPSEIIPSYPSSMATPEQDGRIMSMDKNAGVMESSKESSEMVHADDSSVSVGIASMNATTEDEAERVSE